MTKIIDIHTHVGDIFHENRNITFKTNIKKGDYEDPFVEVERSGYTKPLIVSDQKEHQRLIDAGQYRVWECTLENFLIDMTESKVDYACLLPVLPNTSFEEYLAASKLDNRLLPFTCPDFSLKIPELEKKLELDLSRGARALKIHPILQNISLEDPKVEAAVEVFGKADLPTIFHVGENSYYGPDKNYPSNPEFGNPRYFYEFAPRFKNYPLIAAHCCLIAEDFANNTKGLDNVYTDTTMCSAELMKKGVELIGEDKILFGTDYPFGTFKYSVEEVRRAFNDDERMLNKVFFENAAKLLKFSENK
ncbi:amidohydrolase family protein [Vagococcus sp. DIV0080]|uniref:Amidohydrolase family protein n=1 Tax=Candidatus Vagococcus giribetii TaxID=2230876 RepID=A0ABS3HUI6_9ENTE|nr:amidohydrolase family protein [Vagococcus sp. DIV0080]MBO0477419.1 amidohydrolase family protein [Vagococcus sp. DIV0080]